MAYLENELPIALDDLPNFQLRQIEGEAFENQQVQGMSAEKVQIEAAKDFVLELQKQINSKHADIVSKKYFNLHELHLLNYLAVYNTIYTI